ncbi:hypothetical protein ANO11243_005070 [Dothideomycetidae sp. 11243]|nr:hypothetical protein ANO11243_005070 [fungal sp. No.11243]
MIRTSRRSGFRLSRSSLVFIALLSIVYLLFGGFGGLLYPSSRPDGFSGGKLLHLAGPPSANSTLGGLILAANITRLDVTIPNQPAWKDSDVKALKADKGSLLSRGSALAWLGHLNLLRWFLSTDLETILILEDDVDWDIHLRTTQVPRVAATVRHLLSKSKQDGELDTPDPATAGGYWGSADDWDVLYLGHCGDAMKPGKWNFRVQRASFYDETLLPRKKLEKKTRKLLRSIALPDNVRVVHQSVQPLCTFGFALTRTAARRLLYEIANKEGESGTPAYDVRVLEACRDMGLRCWSSTPELFHHMHTQSEIAIVNGNATTAAANASSTSVVPSRTVQMSSVSSTAGAAKATETIAKVERIKDEDDDEDEEGDYEIVEQTEDKKAEHKDSEVAGPNKQTGQTPMMAGSHPKTPKKTRKRTERAPNIACGARWFKARDRAEMESLREVVGRQGRCIQQKPRK